MVNRTHVRSLRDRSIVIFFQWWSVVWRLCFAYDLDVSMRYMLSLILR